MTAARPFRIWLGGDETSQDVEATDIHEAVAMFEPNGRTRVTFAVSLDGGTA